MDLDRYTQAFQVQVRNPGLQGHDDIFQGGLVVVRETTEQDHGWGPTKSCVLGTVHTDEFRWNFLYSGTSVSAAPAVFRQARILV